MGFLKNLFGGQDITPVQHDLMEEFKQHGVSTHYNERMRNQIRDELEHQGIKLMQVDSSDRIGNHLVWVVGKKRIPAYDE